VRKKGKEDKKEKESEKQSKKQPVPKGLSKQNEAASKTSTEGNS